MHPASSPHTPPASPASASPHRPASASRPKPERALRVLLYGVQGVGKSTFGSMAPRPVFLCPEDGASQLDVDRFPAPRGWSEVLEAVRVLTYEDHDYQTLVIDTLDWLEPLCWAHVSHLHGVGGIEEIPYGRGYGEAIEHIRVLVGRLEMLVRSRRMNIVLLAHATTKKMDSARGTFDRFQMKIHDKAQELLRDWVDAVLFARHEPLTHELRLRAGRSRRGARVMHTEWSGSFDALNHFDLPPALPLAWDELAAAARAYQPTDVAALRRSLMEIIPRVREPLRAERAMVEWAGDNPLRLSQLLERVRSKKALEGGGEDLDPTHTGQAG